MNDVLLTPIRLNELETLIQNSVRKVLNEERIPNINEATNQDKLLTIQQASELLSLAVPSIYGLCHRSLIPYMKKGKRLYFSEKELRDWIKSGRRQTIQEMNAGTGI